VKAREAWLDLDAVVPVEEAEAGVAVLEVEVAADKPTGSI
jgi:hypothetical protein